MILALPTRISVLYMFLFSALLLLVELLEGTDPIYAAMVFSFFMIATLAFNVAGGFSRPSGAYIFAYAVLVVMAGTVFKAVLGEPAQSNLQAPMLTMATYVVSAIGMLLAAALTRRIVTSPEGIARIFHIREIHYYESSLGCLVMCVFFNVAGSVLPGGGGQLLHTLTLINPFVPLSVLLSTVAAVRDSGGRSSLNIVNVSALLIFFFLGLMSFSKQGMFMGPVCWLLGVMWGRFRLRPIHYISIIGFAIAAETIMLPIANFGRTDMVTGAFSERSDMVYGYLTHYTQTRTRAQSYERPTDLDHRMFYYNKPEGLMDRFTMMPNDSLLMSFSDQGHYFGYLAIRYYFENWIPHLIDPHKLEGMSVGGNAYMHEMGELAEADTTTGISFSPTAEAFHIDGWRGVALLAPAIWFLLFASCDAVCGDIRRQPLGLFYVLIFAHVAPEGLLGGAIDMVKIINAAFLFGLFFCGFVTPILGKLLHGQQRITEGRQVHLSRLQREFQQAS